MVRGRGPSPSRPPAPSGAWGDSTIASSNNTIKLMPKGMTWKAKRSKNYVATGPGSGHDCICTICTCNHHACPKHVEKDFTCSGQSGYRVDYPRHDCAELPERHKYPSAEPLTRVSAGHFDTINSLTYKAPPHVRTELIQQQQAKRMTFPFTSTTTHRADFTPKQSSPRQSRPKHAVLPMLPLNGTSMAHEAYKDWSKTATRPKAIGPQRSAIAKAPFNADTTYRSDFLPQSHDGARSPPKRPPQASYNPAEGFASTSEYRHSFEPKPIHSCVVPFLPPQDPSATGHIHYTLRHGHGDPQNPHDWEPVGFV
eukprot:TRINITY_DN71559_c0_g1_i1.p1 TRINITY_DN71559_c0_g1~~TRINITY_DN71559_c0_g1_i1.p1  ORF type:complete len:311 (+),score=24.17 TRINITY_DN71559_c0_g1_i1:67-999(+)